MIDLEPLPTTPSSATLWYSDHEYEVACLYEEKPRDVISVCGKRPAYNFFLTLFLNITPGLKIQIFTYETSCRSSP
jgi:hypothetical protein